MRAELSFAEVVDAVAAELEERLPGYLRRQPMRCAGTRFAGPCRRIARVWGLPLEAVPDNSVLNTVDRHLRDRLAEAGACELGAADDHELAVLQARCAAAREAVRSRVAALPHRLEQRSVARVPQLRYAAIGRGEPPVVIINAFGQTRAPWLPLIERLSRRRRVMLWELRDAGARGELITFAEHCEDLDAILAQEGARRCHLLGWCTGAKLAARYSRTRPGAVASQVLLGGSFKHPGRAPELDTAYERNLEALLQAVAREPALAERLRLVLALATDSDVDLDRMDGDALAQHALTRVPHGLKRDVRHPFRDAASLLVYARQHLEFWSIDETTGAPHVPVPTLGVTGQHDQIVSPAGFQAAVERFPVSRFHALAATTHYCIHERPDAVAGLIEEWIGAAQ